MGVGAATRRNQHKRLVSCRPPGGAAAFRLKCTIVAEIDKQLESWGAPARTMSGDRVIDMPAAAGETVRSTAESAPLVLAIDVGTSSTRAMLFTAEGDRSPDGEVQRDYAFDTDSAGGVTADPCRLFDTVVEAIDELLRRRAIGPGRIRGVGVSCFWHSLLAMDRNGAPLTPVLSWADTRSAPDATSLASELNARGIHEQTGCVLHTSYWPAKLRWLARVSPDVARDAACWGGYADYLFWRLCGQFVTSISMASGTGLLNQHSVTWHGPLLEHLGLNPTRLPRLVDRDHADLRLTPDFASRWPALAGIPWFPAVGDGAASNVGSGCTGQERIALSVGTSGVMRLLVKADEFTIPARLWCYRLDCRRFVVGGALSNAGNVMSWLKSTLAVPADVGAHLVAGGPGTRGLTVLPYFAGERTPEWNPFARGAIAGIGLHTSATDILIAAMEGIACRFALVHDLLRLFAAPNYAIVGSGGGLEHWPAWPQIIADALAHDVSIALETEASARGAALLALDALRLIPDLDGVGASTGAVYRPDPHATDAYRELRARIERLTELLDPRVAIV